MKRTKPPQNTKTHLEDVSDVLVIIPKAVFDVLLKQDHAGDLIALYSFYYYTAKWQRTNQVKATNTYCQHGLGMGKPRFQRAKAKLIDIGLIHNVKVHSGGWYIKITYILKKKTFKEVRSQVSDTLKKSGNKQVRNLTTNALSNGSKNALSNNKGIPNFYFEYDFFKEEFAKIWFDEYIPLKKKKKASITERALKSQLKKISNLSGGNYSKAFEILEATLNGGWSDFFPLNRYENKRNGTNGSRSYNKTDYSSVISTPHKN